MKSREDVIKGLECCSKMSGDACRECPYGFLCLDTDLPYGMPHLAIDALALLKAQEPRVMTDEELMDRIRKAPIVQKPAVDAMEMVEVQAPRIMTLEEIEDWDGAVFFEAYETDMYYVLIETVEPTAGMNGAFVFVNVLPGEHHRRVWDGENYGSIWRCWTSRPTDEQREATPWE